MLNISLDFKEKKGFNHNYSIWDLKPLLGNLFNLYLDMNNEFPDKEDDILWENGYNSYRE